jgi:hypothetical protein
VQYKNLGEMTELVVASLVLALLGAAFIRAAAVLYRILTRIPRRYPQSWTTAQCQLMDRFRLGVGVMLTAFWVAQHFAAPLMPTNWPFGLLEALSVATLLLLTNAWIVLLLPRDWGELGVFTARFGVTMAVLVVWWAVMFGGTAWMLMTAASKPAPRPVIGGPVVAVLQALAYC